MIRWFTLRIYSEYWMFSAPQAKIFQKMIKINEKWPKKIFAWVYLILFWSNILHNRENFKKISKISKISTFWKFLRFFFKNWWEKILKKMKKNWAENFRFELGGNRWVQKWCFFSCWTFWSKVIEKKKEKMFPRIVHLII